MGIKITLSGSLGSGKSTVGKLLAKRFNIPFYSTGLFFRDYAKVRDMDALKANLNAEDNSAIDDYVDGRILKLDKELDSFILDSRMAWHFVKNPTRFYLEADRRIAAERVFMDESRDTESYSSIDEAMTKIAARADSERRRYSNLYNVDIGDLKNYHHHIETSGVSPEVVADCIEECLTLESMPSHWAADPYTVGALVRT